MEYTTVQQARELNTQIEKRREQKLKKIGFKIMKANAEGIEVYDLKRHKTFNYSSDQFLNRFANHKLS